MNFMLENVVNGKDRMLMGMEMVDVIMKIENQKQINDEFVNIV